MVVRKLVGILQYICKSLHVELVLLETTTQVWSYEFPNLDKTNQISTTDGRLHLQNKLVKWFCDVTHSPSGLEVFLGT